MIRLLDNTIRFENITSAGTNAYALKLEGANADFYGTVRATGDIIAYSS
jgi:hypothetical protein